MKKIAIVIPARYASTRLPAKPLLEVKNKPIIQYVYEAAKKSKFGEFIACSSYPECKYVKPKEEKKVEYLEGENCPKCGKPLVKRHSKKGDFYACSGYPTCLYIKGQENDVKEEPVITDKKCPKCGAPLLLRKGKNGKSDFLGCSSFPRCKHIESVEK